MYPVGTVAVGLLSSLAACLGQENVCFLVNLVKCSIVAKHHHYPSIQIIQIATNKLR